MPAVGPLGVSLTVVGTSTLGSGLLLLRQRARTAGVVTSAVGAAVLVAAGLRAAGDGDAARWLLLVTTFVAVPAGLLCYPAPRWRSPLESAWLVVVLGLGLATLLWWGTQVAGTVGIAGACALMAAIWWRIETAADGERRALQWLALVVAVCGLVVGISEFSTQASGTNALAFVVLALVGPALVIGVSQPEIVDVRGVIVSIVVVAVCVLAVTSVFVAVAALLDLAGLSDISIGAYGVLAGLTAVLFHPLQVLLRGTVDEALFGGRPDPLGAASRVAGRVGDDPVLALRAIREALVLPYAALRAAGQDLAVSGTATSHTRSFRLEGGGPSEPELVVGLRPGDLRLSGDDDHVLRLVAPLLAQTMRARALAADVQESREATVTAVEEERRRLRRDLHDGLGPRLSGIAFTSDAARNLVRTDPEAADQLLRDLRAETNTAIEDIRRLVYAMRPPALDELGLVPALRQQAIGLRGRHGRPLRVELVVPEALPSLSAAVEVAAYRIVLEALTNVARHTDASGATVCLTGGPAGLGIEVTDDGGPGEAWVPGVGLASMRERAAELGGTLTAAPTPSGGRVTALLPLT